MADKPDRTTPTTISGTDVLALRITYLNIVLYAVCYQLQLPVEPFLVKSLTDVVSDANKAAAAASVGTTYGRLQSFFSLIQTVGSPLVGVLLDRIGIRQTSVLVFLASAASYAILSQATNLHMLFLSKVPTALQHAFLVAQATAATSTGNNAAARAQALARMTTAYTIGATVGPALGGYLVELRGDLYLGAKLAVAGSLLSVALSFLFLRNNNPQIQQKKVIHSNDDHGDDQDKHEEKSNMAKHKDKNQPVVIQTKKSFLDDLKHSGSIAIRKNVWPLLFIKVVGGVASSMYSTALPLALAGQLDFEPSQLGLTMSTSSFAVAAFGAVAMAPLTAQFGSPALAKFGLLSRSFMVVVIATVVASGMVGVLSSSSSSSNMVEMRVIVACAIHALASHALATSLTTQTTGLVNKREQGALLGLEHGLFSLARIGAPTLGVALLNRGSFGIVAASCAGIDCLLVMGLALAVREKSEKENSPPSKNSSVLLCKSETKEQHVD